MAPKKRDNAYYRERLEKEHPGIFAKLKAGEFSSESEAFVAAGLRKAPKTINALQRAWRLASPAERREFAASTRRAAAAAMAKRGTPPPAPVPVVDSEGRLTPDAAGKLATILANRKLRVAEAMAEMGLTPYDWTLSTSLTNRQPIRHELAEALQRWIAANAHHIPW